MYDFMAKNEYEAGLREAEIACDIATRLPILNDYSDDEVETELKERYFDKFGATEFDPVEKRVLFYNSQIGDRVALTQQYLHYFLSSGYTVLVMVPYRSKSIAADDIISKIKNDEKAELFFPRGRNRIEILNSIRRKVVSFCPKYTFIHMVPGDAVAFSFFANLRSSIRYYVVHNDHTFWLGKIAADYFLEFRNFGLAIAKYRRRLAMDKVILNAYYPILSNDKFEGFSFDTEGKLVIMIAANSYKFMMDHDKTILNVLRKVTSDYVNTIVVIAGHAQSEIVTFIEEHSLAEKFYTVGHRKDFFALMSRVDIYINSFPLIGALITQFAVAAKTALVSYTKEGLLTTNTCEDLLKRCELPITFVSRIDFESRIRILIESPQEREQFSEESLIQSYTEDDFDSNLESILLAPSTMAVDHSKEYELHHNDDLYLNYYLQRKYVLDSFRTRVSHLDQVKSIFGDTPFYLKNKVLAFKKRLIASINR